ncbi:hypothetical protein VTK56DRAFT_2177 [Thermocarpiscus australiensis]
MRVRPSPALLVAIAALVLTVLIAPHVARFVEIFRAHAGPALTQEEVETAYNRTSGGKSRQEYIPKIIHQAFHNWKDPGNDTLPADWEAVRQTCINANPDFEYRLWTESESLNFIATHYPWFLSTYEGYKFPVQRVDAFRYFLMLKLGGIYIDLDNGCSRDLKPLLYYPAWVTDGGHGALSNNILAARPDHPYWKMMTDSLIPWSFNYFFPMITIHYSSGQWFETAIWQRYHAQLPEEPREEDRIYRIMMDMREGAARWVFFTQGRGGTWDRWDKAFFDSIGNRLIPWLGEHAAVLLVVVVAVAGGLLWYRKRRRASKKGYRTVATEAEMV